MKRVKHSYNPDLSKIGTVEEVDDDTARELVREGRARYVEPESPAPELDNGGDAADDMTISPVAAATARANRARGAVKSDDPTG